MGCSPASFTFRTSTTMAPSGMSKLSAVEESAGSSLTDSSRLHSSLPVFSRA